jgi:hypothetical protein
LYPFIERAAKSIAVIIEAYHSSKLNKKLIITFFSLGYLHMLMKLLGIDIADFDVIDQGLFRFSISVGYWKQMGA